jgi:hypothetical protein
MTDENQPPKLHPIPGFSAYVASLDGLDVFRTRRALRGVSATTDRYRMKPVIHPRGSDWVFQLFDDTGARKRLPIPKLTKLMLDTYAQSCEPIGHA